MGEIVTRWVVSREQPVEAGDADAAGVIADKAVERWIEEIRDSYLECCPVLRNRASDLAADLGFRTDRLPPGSWLGHPTSVLVTAGVSEVRPESFTLAVRIRPLGAEAARPVAAGCAVELIDRATGQPLPLGDAVRDELIALEHAARHLN